MTGTLSMPNQFTDQPLLLRDGASQAERRLAALDPDAVALDERSLRDLLAFAREYARELRYWAAEGGRLQELGDWSAFLGAEIDLDEVVAYMQTPERFAAAQAQPFTRPHFALFLTFLQLFRYAQQQLNTLTRRHLDFTYRQLLRMTPQPGRPDQANVLVDLTPEVAEYLLPAGTLLQAGADSAGQERVYRTDHDLVVNQAQVARLSSVYADQAINTLRTVREESREYPWEALLAMLRLVLGRPLPGDTLPPYESQSGEKREVTIDLLKQLRALVSFVQQGLGLPDWGAYRSLLQLVARRPAADEDWEKIARLIEQVGRKTDPNFHLDPANRRNFDANLRAALGGQLPSFDGLTEVDSLDDLYRQSFRRQEVKDFIRDRLDFEKAEDFQRLWQSKDRIEKEWQAINQMLIEARRRLDPQAAAVEPPLTLAVDNPQEMDVFIANLAAALGPKLFDPLSPIRDLAGYDAALQELERFFLITAEQYATLITLVDQREPPPQAWAQVEAILAAAYPQRVYADRRQRLQTIRESTPDGFARMIAYAAGAESTASALTPFERLQELLPSQADRDYLSAIRDRAQAQPAQPISADEWTRVYTLVELAQRRRENLGEPVAQQATWRNLYPLADATTAQVTLGVAAATQTPHWRTFGQAPRLADRANPPPAALGWAISSPLLALSQGQRTITLTLGFQPEPFDEEAIRTLLPLPLPAAEKAPVIGPFKPAAAQPAPAGQPPPVNPFRVEISTAKGWIEPESIAVQLGDYVVPTDERRATLPALQLTLTFDASVDPIAPLPAAEALGASSHPILRITLRPIWQAPGRYVTHYPPFKPLVLLHTHLHVAVAGLLPQQLQNDEGDLAVNKPFAPFGSQPDAGARFYVGHPELAAKPLASLVLRFQWLGAPPNLKIHYANYGLDEKSSFTARVSLVDQGVERVLREQAPLFASATSDPQQIAIADLPPARVRDVPALAMGDDLLAWSRYLQWELNAPDLQHAAYPSVTAQKALALAADIVAKKEIKPAEYQVNPPYTPKIKRLTVDYSAALELSSTDMPAGPASTRLYHLHPFGYAEITVAGATEPLTFLPQYDHEGELYIGLGGLQPPQTLTLLMQLAEGSANPDLPSAPVTWSYLSANRWVSLMDGQLLADGTRGLINTGLITLDLPAAHPNTLLPGDLYWLRAAIPQHSTSVCATVAIHTQAVAATFVDQGNAPDHLAQPLPPASITGLVVTQPAVAGLRQPYTSYGGAAAETESAFATRVSERLRHKDRALTVWDYEHLILARFPQIYKAKCLPATPDQPGQVTIVVIPDIREQLPFDPFAPKAPANLLADIGAYLAAHTPAHATVQVKNAHYVAVKVRFAVRFRPGGNQGYYKQQLNEELNRFLSPWAYAEGADLVIGGRIYANQIINFLEERPYVDYITQVKLFSSDDGRNFTLVHPDPAEGYWVTTDRPDGVLVAARQHEIDILVEESVQEQRLSGINFMQIELDFMVAEGDE